MGRRTQEQQSETQGSVEKSLKGEQKLASEYSDSRLYVLAYQAILARELLINDFHELDLKYF
jgi:hypothetical protein